MNVLLLHIYHKTSNQKRTLVGSKIVDPDVVGAAPYISSFSYSILYHLTVWAPGSDICGLQI